MRIRLTIGCLVLFAATAFGSDPASDSFLEKVRQKVTSQLAKSTNYACIETLDRSYWRPTKPSVASCNSPSEAFSEERVMHDRLRLDLAVSKGAEIFSWHGESKFVSSDVGKVVEGGAISSGSFVGLLRNIFTVPGVNFAYRGKAREHGVEVVRFNYVVAKQLSLFRVEGMAKKSAIVPFHGSFSADAETFDLVQLKTHADKIPFGLDICSTETEVEYQIANISGLQTLLPKTFQLNIDDGSSLHTISQGEYSRCHEFRAESKLRFDLPESSGEHPAEQTVNEWLVAGLKLQVALLTTIDDRTSFTGDPVQATLTAAVRSSQGATVVPKGAMLTGVITELSTFYVPRAYTSLRIEFTSVSFANKTYFLRSIHQPTTNDERAISSVYQGALTESNKAEMEQGTIFIRSLHLHLDRTFKGDWVTVTPRYR